jgi:hypothetical protein
MCAGVPTIEMKIFHGLLVGHNTGLCGIPTFQKNNSLQTFNLFEGFFCGLYLLIEKYFHQ